MKEFQNYSRNITVRREWDKGFNTCVAEVEQRVKEFLNEN